MDRPFKVCLPVVVFFLCSKSAGHDHHHGRLGLDHVSITWGKSPASTSEHGSCKEVKTRRIYSSTLMACEMLTRCSEKIWIGLAVSSLKWSSIPGVVDQVCRINFL